MNRSSPTGQEGVCAELEGVWVQSISGERSERMACSAPCSGFLISSQLYLRSVPFRACKLHLDNKLERTGKVCQVKIVAKSGTPRGNSCSVENELSCRAGDEEV